MEPAAVQEKNLTNLSLCRLCGEENLNGVDLNSKDNEGRSLCNLINEHLPVKVDSDERLPQSICTGCLSQVQSIVEFYDLLQAGQKKIKELFAKEDENSAKINNAAPKRNRGRPRKVVCPPQAPADGAQNGKDTSVNVPIEEVSKIENPLGKRTRKTPVRYQGAVHTKDLERILMETEENKTSAERTSEDKEVIGRVESLEGTDLGEVAILSKNKRPSLRYLIEFKCEACGELFRHENKFLAHQASHKTTEYTVCSVCNEKFTSTTDLQTHQEITKHEGYESKTEKDENFDKGDTKESEVQSNKKNSKSTDGASSHINQNGEELGFACDICGKKLKHINSIAYHKETEHNIKRKYSCLKCNKTFKHRLLLLRHQLVHTEHRPHKCDLCEARFKTKTHLIHHKVVHTKEKKFQCHICEQSFSFQTSLNIHLRWHTGQKPYQCEFCKKSFSQKGNLQEHIRIHTNEKPYSCKFCDRRFKTSSQCKNHIKSHIGLKPWKCEYCSKAFLNKASWVAHVRRHTGEKPYVCSICTRDFPVHSDFKKHLRLHTGEKPYKCQICDRAFSNESNMIKHRRVHLKKAGLENILDQSNEVNSNFNIWTVFKPEDESNKQEDLNLQQIYFISYPEAENEDQNEKVSEQKEKIESEKDLDSTDQSNNMMHLMDELGNPLRFTTQEGATVQLTTDGESLQLTFSDGNTIPVRLTDNDTSTLQTPMLPTTMVFDQDEVEQNINSLGFVTEHQDVRLLTSISDPSLEFLPLA
ncbi:zinc finger protein 250-like [Cimex lectularius]|uniref:Zinc finger protein n=1 Tax=Cimex lectularius TaxID=79782 RepID=A0A8I6RMF9_CIMLE|nr:zinc finger protein 250-like [Cimex lectularius]